MKKLLITLLVFAVFAGPAIAGVVYEIEVTDHEQSPPKTDTIETKVDGKNLKMGIPSGNRSERGEMIFRGDRREMVVVDHQDKSYSVIDEELIEKLQGQVSAAMAQMQQALKNVPADKRAMIENMMKQRMPNPAQAERPKSELKKTGEKGTKNGYPCVKYVVHKDGLKIREMWVTDWDNIEGGSDVKFAYEDMAGFFKKMLDTIPDFGQGGGGADPVFEHLKEIGGFPVVNEEFDENGDPTGSSKLRSAKRRSLDAAEFEPPSGYKRQSMGF